MAKLNGKLTYKDWCILKHSLRNQVENKKKFMEDNPEGILGEQTLAILNHAGMDTSDLKLEQYNLLVKEVEEEKKTLERVTELIESFNIGTKAK